MITPVKVPETPLIVTRPELEAGDAASPQLLEPDSPPPPVSPPLCDDPDGPGDHDGDHDGDDDGDHGDQELSGPGEQHVPVATLVTTA